MCVWVVSKLLNPDSSLLIAMNSAERRLSVSSPGFGQNAGQQPQHGSHNKDRMEREAISRADRSRAEV
jgi:hypothetical protein